MIVVALIHICVSFIFYSLNLGFVFWLCFCFGSLLPSNDWFSFFSSLKLGLVYIFIVGLFSSSPLSWSDWFLFSYLNWILTNYVMIIAFLGIWFERTFYAESGSVVVFDSCSSCCGWNCWFNGGQVDSLSNTIVVDESVVCFVSSGFL